MTLGASGVESMADAMRNAVNLNGIDAQNGDGLSPDFNQGALANALEKLLRCHSHDPAMTSVPSHYLFLESKVVIHELSMRTNNIRRSKMPAILLWLLGVPIPIIILLLLLWH